MVLGRNWFFQSWMKTPVRDEENALARGSLVLYPLPFGWKDRPRFTPRPLRTAGCISAPVACGDGMLSLSPGPSSMG